jgi:malate dehydrogenase
MNIPRCDHSAKVAVIGAGNVGSALAQRIAEKNLADVVLLDISAGRPQGLALDLMEARGVEGHDRHIIGTSDYQDCQGADVVVITAGLPRKPGMSRDDLLKANGETIIQVTQKAIAQAPNAVLIVVTNPLDEMTYLAWQASGLPPRQVLGMAGVLDSARFETFIAMELGISIADIKAMVLGGHGDLMVPLPRYTSVSGIPITELMEPEAIERLVERTRKGGSEIVNLMQTGSAFYAPASAVYLMVESILINRHRIIPVAAYVQGEYGLKGLFVGVPARLGMQGIEEVLELHLTDAEHEALHRSANVVRENIERAKALLPRDSPTKS